MRVAETITASALMGLGGVVLHDALRLGIGWGTDGPQSGFFPFWLATCLAAVAATILVKAQLQRSAKSFTTRQQIVPVLKVLGPLAAFIVLTDPPGPWSGVGLYVASAFYLAFYMRWVGRHHWLTICIIAMVVPVVAFVIFEQWFLVPMPKGPLEAWLGY